MNLFEKRHRWIWHVAFWFTYILLLSYTFGQIMPFLSAQSRVLTGLVLHACFAYLNWFWLIPRFFLHRQYFSYFGFSISLLFLLGWMRYWFEYALPTPLISSVTPILPLKLIFIAFSFISIWVLSSLFRLLEDRIKTMQLENELKHTQLHSELRFLKSQINPHFLFNTLNNVYSLAYLKSDQAPPMILKLSGMLRYMLYDCDAPKVSLQKEIEYLQDYIKLQVLNPADRLKVVFEIQNNVPNRMIEPMLFVSFIENAFKHGNLSQPAAYIRIRLTNQAHELVFLVENSVGNSKSKDKIGGLGLHNIRQRLVLLYPEKHNLKIVEEENLYKVHLSLKITQP
jgi:LytS/YehU family sensor histidine kinase